MIRNRKSRRQWLADDSDIGSQPWARVFPRQWQRLFDRCRDDGSRTRLLVLRDRFAARKWPMAHSAAGEVDVASLLVRAGFSLAFLEETSTRTADLECYWGRDRCFAEVTVMTPMWSHSPVAFPTDEGSFGPETPMGDFQAALEHRLMARMVEKARQLDRYCAPIVLAITVPSWPPQFQRKESYEALDVQRLAGMSVSALAGLPELSALLLTFWEAEPRQRRSLIRMADAHWMTRTVSDVGQPRIRLLANNPFARYRLGKPERVAIQDAL